MAWANAYIARLKAGETVGFRPRGNSMEPKIRSGALCTVAPIVDHGQLAIGDIVLCKVNGSVVRLGVKAARPVCHQKFGRQAAFRCRT